MTTKRLKWNTLTTSQYWPLSSNLKVHHKHFTNVKQRLAACAQTYANCPTNMRSVIPKGPPLKKETGSHRQASKFPPRKYVVSRQQGSESDNGASRQIQLKLISSSWRTWSCCRPSQRLPALRCLLRLLQPPAQQLVAPQSLRSPSHRTSPCAWARTCTRCR